MPKQTTQGAIKYMRAWKKWMDGDAEAHVARGKVLQPLARGAAAAPQLRMTLLQGAAAGAGLPQPVGKHGETKGVLWYIIH